MAAVKVTHAIGCLFVLGKNSPTTARTCGPRRERKEPLLVGLLFDQLLKGGKAFNDNPNSQAEQPN